MKLSGSIPALMPMRADHTRDWAASERHVGHLAGISEALGGSQQMAYEHVSRIADRVDAPLVPLFEGPIR